MANHKSALKRTRQSEIRRIRNKSVKTRVKNVVKTVRANASQEDATATQESLKTAKSIIDKAAKRGVIHKRTAARKISRLSKLAHSLEK